MRWAAAVVAALVTAGVAGCSSPDAVPTPAASSVAAAARLTGDAAFEKPFICAAVHDYDTVQTAIGARDIPAMHRAAEAAAADDAAGWAKERAHTWSAGVQPLLKAYFAKGAEQVQWYRDIAKAKRVDEAVNLDFPDGSAVSTPVFAAIHFPVDYPCPS